MTELLTLNRMVRKVDCDPPKFRRLIAEGKIIPDFSCSGHRLFHPERTEEIKRLVEATEVKR